MSRTTPDPLDTPVSSVKYPVARAGVLQETFYLDEGPVTLSFPADLTQESYEELEAASKLFLMRAKRRATKEPAN